jgi:transposase
MAASKNKQISAALWKRIKPLLPEVKPSAKGGRPRPDDERALNGILFVLRTGIPWEDLPQELGLGSGMTCWRRLRDWQAAGVWSRLHQLLLAELRGAGKLDFSRASQPARLGGLRTTGGRAAKGAGRARAAQALARQAACRQGLRLRALPGASEAARNQGSDRPQRVDGAQ